MAMRFANQVFRVSPEMRLDRTLTAVLNFILALLVVLMIYFFFRSG
jgi:hypothetical protein